MSILASLCAHLGMLAPCQLCECPPVVLLSVQRILGAASSPARLVRFCLQASISASAHARIPALAMAGVSRIQLRSQQYVLLWVRNPQLHCHVKGSSLFHMSQGRDAEPNSTCHHSPRVPPPDAKYQANSTVHMHVCTCKCGSKRGCVTSRD